MPLFPDFAKSLLEDRREDLSKLPIAEREQAIRNTFLQASQHPALSFQDDETEFKQTFEDTFGKVEQGDVLESGLSKRGSKVIKTPSDEEVRLLRSGVALDRDLPAGDFKLGFGVDPVKDLRNVLNQHFGKPVPVFKSGSSIIYIDPESNEAVRANFGGGAKVGKALPMIADVASTIAAGTTGGTPGLIVKETLFSGAGTTVGEMTRLAIGKGLGVHDLSFEDMAIESVKVGGEAAAFTAGIGTLVAGGKHIENFVKGGIFTKDEAAKFGLDVQQADAIIKEINQIIKQGGGKGQVKATLAQKADDVLVGAKQAELERLPEQAPRFAKREAEDIAASKEALEIVSKPKIEPFAPKDIAEVAAGRVSKRVEQAKQIVAKNQAQLTSQLEAIGKVQKEAVGEPTLKVLKEKQDIAKTAENAVWEKVKKIGGFDEKKEAFGIAIPAGVNTSKLKTILERRAKTATTKIEGRSVAGIFKNKPKSADLADFNREISDLRKELRAASKNKQFGDPQTRDLRNVIQSMVEDRKLALVKAGRKDVIEQIEKAEKATLEFNEKFNRSVVGDLTKVNDKGVPVIKSKTFVDDMLKRDEVEVDQFLDVIGDNPELIAKWKEGLADAFKTVAFKDNKFNKQAGEKFIKANESLLGKFFTKADINGFRKTGKLSEKVASQSKRLEAFKKRANERFGSGSLASVDPRGLSKFITGKSGKWKRPSGVDVKDPISKIKFARNITADSPAAWQGVQNEFKKQIRNDVLDPKTGQINPTKIASWVSEPSNAAIIKETLGNQYFKNLSTLNSTIQIISKKGKLLGVDEARQGLIQSVRAIAAPPLTRRGRAFTSAIMFQGKAAHKAMANAILDERTMTEVAKLAEQNVITRRVAEKAFSLGFALPDNEPETQ